MDNSSEGSNASVYVISVIFGVFIVSGLCLIVVLVVLKRRGAALRQKNKESKKKEYPLKKITNVPLEPLEIGNVEVDIDFDLDKEQPNSNPKPHRPEVWTPEEFGMKSDGKFFVLRLFKDCNIQMISTTCAICLGPFDEEEEIKQAMGCRHIYHKPCIDEWLQHRQTCPLCNNPYDVDIDFQTFVALEITAK